MTSTGYKSYVFQSNEDLTNGDLAMIFALGGLVQGFGFLLGETHISTRTVFACNDVNA